MKFSFHRVQLQSDGLALALLHHWMLGWRAIAFGSSETGWPLCFGKAEKSGEVDCLNQDGMGEVLQREEVEKWTSFPKCRSH